MGSAAAAAAGHAGRLARVPLIVFPASHTPSFCICRARCWQPGVRTPTPPGVSEDCLYLNVFVPQNVVSVAVRAVVAVKAALLALPKPRGASMVRAVLSALLVGSWLPEV